MNKPQKKTLGLYRSRNGGLISVVSTRGTLIALRHVERGPDTGDHSILLTPTGRYHIDGRKHAFDLVTKLSNKPKLR